jgi:hypothetical protein
MLLVRVLSPKLEDDWGTPFRTIRPGAFREALTRSGTATLALKDARK